MAAPLSTTGTAVQTALSLRLVELGHALCPSHISALVADVMVAVNANAGTVVADAATDTVSFKPPPHTKF